MIGLAYLYVCSDIWFQRQDLPRSQAGFELTVFLLQAPKCWDQGNTPPHVCFDPLVSSLLMEFMVISGLPRPCSASISTYLHSQLTAWPAERLGGTIHLMTTWMFGSHFLLIGRQWKYFLYFLFCTHRMLHFKGNLRKVNSPCLASFICPVTYPGVCITGNRNLRIKSTYLPF